MGSFCEFLPMYLNAFSGAWWPNLEHCENICFVQLKLCQACTCTNIGLGLGLGLLEIYFLGYKVIFTNLY